MVNMLMVGFDNGGNKGDIPVLTVGKADQKTHNVEILNAFMGDEAVQLYNKLISKGAPDEKEI